MGVINDKDIVQKQFKGATNLNTRRFSVESTRLVLRNFTEGDVKSCFENFGKDKNLGRFIPLFPMKTIDEMEQLIKALIPNHDAWAIVEKHTQQIIGYLTIDIPYPQLKIGEIGYIIGEKFQHNGYAREAVNVILNEYLVVKDLFMIEAKYNIHNAASANLLKKVGFREEARLRDRRIDCLTGNRSDLIICSITKNEYASIIDWTKDLQQVIVD